METLKSWPIVATLLLLWCGVIHNTPVDEVAQAHNKFSLAIYDKLLEKASTGGKDPGNVFFGAISITTALMTAMLGTSGLSEEEMISAMRLKMFVDSNPNLLHPTFKDLADRLYVASANCTLLSANGIFLEQTHPFIQQYLNDVKTYYDAEIRKVDFMKAYEAARLDINEWVENKTNNKIKDLLQQGTVDSMTVMVIVNAIYFKGLWKTPFLPENTKQASFYGPGDSDICVNMMHNISDTFGYAYSAELEAKVLKLPYDCETQRKLSMYVILPDANDGLANLEAALKNNITLLSKLLSSTTTQEVKVWLPRFTFEYSDSLKTILQSLGMNAIFEPDGITGMSQHKLTATDVVHKAFVEVNEEGTEAAAATAIVIGVTMVRIPKEFKADHPFLFVIADDITKTILFMGRVVTPTKCEKKPKRAKKSCIINGVKYKHGKKVPTTNECVGKCKCKNGKRLCKKGKRKPKVC